MGRLSTVMAFCLLSGALRASDTGWTLAQSAHFEVYSHAGSGEARQVLHWFERLHSFFEQQTGVNVDRRLPLRVVVFSSNEEYAAFRPNRTADAYYAANANSDYIVLPSPDADRLAAHEYWHFVARTGALRLPLWLSEGLAEFFSTVRLETRGGRMGAAPPLHVGLLRHDNWLPLTTLLSVAANSRALRERETSGTFYAESWALAHMLKLSPDYAPSFPQLLERLASGMASAEALEDVYGGPVGSIANDLRGWFLKGRTAPVPPASPSEAVSIDLSEVSPFAMRSLLAALNHTAEIPDHA